jgi:two-component system, NtrC family, response regulator AtoC
MEVKHPDGVEATLQTGSPPRDQFFVKPVSAVMKELGRIIIEIAPTDIPVLVAGESGSGKEAIAQQIHQLSSRSNAPFAKLACTTVTRQLAEKILCFDKGLQVVESLLNAGTIFLDEVSDLDLAVQPKLLHVLSDGRPVASGPCLRARIISSTARNLVDEIHQGRFREELYYRLNGVCLRLPPLRRRPEDIPLLVEFFLAKYAGLLKRPKPTVTARAMARLVGYPWPGNIRQLEYAVKKVVALGDGEEALRDLDGNGSGMGFEDGELQRLSLKQAARAASRQAEREMILKALERTRWNRKRAARELRISYKALLYKLKQIGFDTSLHPSGGQGERS